MRFNPYDLVYLKKAMLSIEFEYNTLRMETEVDLDIIEAQKERFLQLNGLYELRMHALLHIEVILLQRKVWHDKHIKENTF